jgi:hypothetical protein
MTCEERTRPVRGGSEGDASQAVSASSVAPGTDTRNVEELLSLGREPFEPCGASYFTVAIHLVECERPTNHPGGCGPLRDEDIDAEPYPVPDRHEYAAELADRAHDDRATGLT